MTWRSGAVLLGVTLLAFSAQRALAWQSDRSQASGGKAASAAASAEVEGLVDTSGSISKADMAQLLVGATAGFRGELEARADRLTKAIDDNAVKATGQALSTGVSELADDRATVIVGTVETKSTENVEPRNYRLKVNLPKADGTWLVSGLEFVAWAP